MKSVIKIVSAAVKIKQPNVFRNSLGSFNDKIKTHIQFIKMMKFFFLHLFILRAIEALYSLSAVSLLCDIFFSSPAHFPFCRVTNSHTYTHYLKKKTFEWLVLHSYALSFFYACIFICLYNIRSIGRKRYSEWLRKRFNMDENITFYGECRVREGMNREIGEMQNE